MSIPDALTLYHRPHTRSSGAILGQVERVQSRSSVVKARALDEELAARQAVARGDPGGPGAD